MQNKIKNEFRKANRRMFVFSLISTVLCTGVVINAALNEYYVWMVVFGVFTAISIVELLSVRREGITMVEIFNNDPDEEEESRI